MTISNWCSRFAGFSVVEWSEKDEGTLEPSKAYTIRLDYNEVEEGATWSDRFLRFLACPGSDQVSALIVGMWSASFGDADDGAEQIVETLVSARDRLPGLKALFFGDITYEECEMSWIQQTDVSPLMLAFDGLEHFRVRGGQGLSFGRLSHPNLKSLAVETGGMDVNLLRELITADLPNLEHLELWLGDDGYGWNGTVEDLQPVLSGKNFPKLKYLGLKNSCIADDIAKAVVTAPILERVEILDLSMGTLSDEGGAALAASEVIRGLKKLDLHHHFLTDDMQMKIKWLGIEVDLSEAEDPDEDYRYVSVGE